MKGLYSMLLISFCLLYSSTKAQSVDAVFLDAAYKRLVNSKSYSLEVAALMPAAHYSFKPSPDEMTFAEQLLHVCGNLRWLLSEYLKGKEDPLMNSYKGSNKDSILSVLNKTYDYALRSMAEFPAAQLPDSVEFFAGPMTKLQIINLINDHQTHHRGQIIVYLRMKGIKPPAYRGW
jgi:uncharacterized damage-inducible protein DinB